MAPLIDTHCHLDAPEFAGDIAAVRKRAARQGVHLCVIPAVGAGNFEAVRQLAHAQGDAYALGIHPLCTPAARPEDLDALDQALTLRAADPRLVAVGEIGLDFFVDGLDADKQAAFFHRQLELARDHRLPVIVHVRRSVDQVLKHLRQVGRGRAWQGIAHAFNGSEQQAHACLDSGLRLGFGGAVTFERALRLRRLARGLPDDAIVMETDSPDIQPHWLYRTEAQRRDGGGQARNEPGELPRIAAVVAGLRGVAADEWAATTTRNAHAALPRLTGLMAAPAPDASAA